MGIRRTEASFHAGGGRLLFRRAWLPEAPERLLVVVHGFAEHSGRYEGFGSWFAQRGCAVHAYDHQGHGRSSGVRSHVHRFADLLDDLGCFVERTQAEHPELRCTLVGHSMGGLVATAFALERRPEIFALVTSGAALALGPSLSRSKMWLARALRAFAPRMALDAGLPPEALSRDAEVVRRYVEDPLVGTKMTTSLAVELMNAVARTERGDARLEHPVLLLHGGDDSLCAPAGSEAFHRKLSGRAASQSAFRIYPGLRHEIFNEPECQQVFEDLLGWLQERESESALAAIGALGEVVEA
jgi:alpha-beta hydrolase superfamily lysophospholipase